MAFFLEPDNIIREFNALVALFDQRTAAMYDRMDPPAIYRRMRADCTGLELAASRFRALAVLMGYDMNPLKLPHEN